MASGGRAGGSAAKKAEQFQRLADQWHQGAVGEELTAEALAPLAACGFRVFHDLKVPGSRANIDHLVIGPTGVFAIDSKNHRTRLSFNKGTLWAGRYSQTEKLRRTRWEADKAAEALGLGLADGAGVGEGAEGAGVVAVQCIHGTAVPVLDGPLEGVRVVDLAGLTALLKDAEPVLSPRECTELVGRAVTVWSSWEPPARSRPPRQRPNAPSPAKARAAAPGRRTLGDVLPPAPATRVRPPARRRKGQPWWAPLVEFALTILLMWVMLTKVIPAMAESAIGAISNSITTTTTAPATAAAVPPLQPVQITGGITCPQKHWGWVLTIEWPGDQAALTHYELNQRTKSGWAYALPWRDKAEPRQFRLDPGTSLTVRARPVGTGPSPDFAQATFTAPAGRC